MQLSGGFGDQLPMRRPPRTGIPAYSNPLYSEGLNGAPGHLLSAQHLPLDNGGDAMMTPDGVLSSAKYEEEVVGPFISSLKTQQNDAQLFAAISSQMNSLYDFFQKLNNQDKAEIRQLRDALHAKDSTIHKLEVDQTTMRHQLEKEKANSAARQVQQQPAPQPKPAPVLERSESSLASRVPTNIVFLPYLLHPAHTLWRSYAAWQYSWTTKRTLWLALAWLLVFLLSVGLLVGLLVPWGDMSSTKFEVGPLLVAVGATNASFLAQANRGAVMFYVVVPLQATDERQQRRRRLLDGAQVQELKLSSVEAGDIYALTQGKTTYLSTYALACGVVYLTKYTNYTMSVQDGHLALECNAFGLGPNATFPFPSVPSVAGRCMRCPYIVPNTPYVLLTYADGGHSTHVMQVNFTTTIS